MFCFLFFFFVFFFCLFHHLSSTPSHYYSQTPHQLYNHSNRNRCCHVFYLKLSFQHFMNKGSILPFQFTTEMLRLLELPRAITRCIFQGLTSNLNPSPSRQAHSPDDLLLPIGLWKSVYLSTDRKTGSRVFRSGSWAFRLTPQDC